MSDRINGVDLKELEIAQWDGISAPPVSPSGSGRIYFDSSAHTFKQSSNGSAYADFGGGGGGISQAAADLRYVMLDQTTQQTLVGIFQFPSEVDILTKFIGYDSASLSFVSYDGAMYGSVTFWSDSTDDTFAQMVYYSTGTQLFYSSQHKTVFGDNSEFGFLGGSVTNPTIKQFGYIAALTTSKYIQWQVDDSDDYFHLTRQDSNILGFKVDMSLLVNTLTAGRVTYAGTSGLLQDSSQLTYAEAISASEKVTNGTFNTNSSNWGTSGTNWQYDGTNHVMQKYADGVGVLNQGITATVGLKYQVQFEVKNYSTGNVVVTWMGVTLGTYSANGVYTSTITTVSNILALVFTPSNTSRLSIDNVSVKQVIGGMTTNKYVVSTGTSSQFLKADGSLDSSAYSVISGLTANYLPKATSATTIGDSGLYDNGLVLWYNNFRTDGLNLYFDRTDNPAGIDQTGGQPLWLGAGANYQLRLNQNGSINMNNLAGSGSGLVAVDNDGLLSWSGSSGGLVPLVLPFTGAEQVIQITSVNEISTTGITTKDITSTGKVGIQAFWDTNLDPVYENQQNGATGTVRMSLLPDDGDGTPHFKVEMMGAWSSWGGHYTPLDITMAGVHIAGDVNMDNGQGLYIGGDRVIELNKGYDNIINIGSGTNDSAVGIGSNGIGVAYFVGAVFGGYGTWAQWVMGSAYTGCVNTFEAANNVELDIRSNAQYVPGVGDMFPTANGYYAQQIVMNQTTNTMDFYFSNGTAGSIGDPITWASPSYGWSVRIKNDGIAIDGMATSDQYDGKTLWYDPYTRVVFMSN